MDDNDFLIDTKISILGAWKTDEFFSSRPLDGGPTNSYHLLLNVYSGHHTGQQEVQLTRG